LISESKVRSLELSNGKNVSNTKFSTKHTAANWIRKKFRSWIEQSPNVFFDRSGGTHSFIETESHTTNGTNIQFLQLSANGKEPNKISIETPEENFILENFSEEPMNTYLLTP
jgi:hypothetical protein